MSAMSAIPAYTCINCQVAFPDGDVQRYHYKSDWHRYNLKRKIAELPPVSADQFRSLVENQQKPLHQDPCEHSLYCQPCKKPFRSSAQFYNHVKSRRHIETERRWLADEDKRHERHLLAQMNSKNAELCGQSEKEPSSVSAIESRAVPVKGDDDDEEWEDTDTVAMSDVDEEMWSGEALPPTACLFCSHSSESVPLNVRHMSRQHSFFIPDAQYVCDLLGLVSYLGRKVGEGFICLWCNERGKHFYSLDAVQKHMRDKGHAKMLHEGDVLAEYADFYDYSSTYPDDDDDGSVSDIEPISLSADNYQLVLPSGAVVGHRALWRYYRQRLKPVTARKTAAAAITAADMLQQYRLMGWTAATQQQVQRTARDMRALRRYQQRDMMRLGVKANKLQKHFRQQCPY